MFRHLSPYYMKPEDFGMSMMDQAYRLRMNAMQHSRTTELDPKTTMWLVRRDHRHRLLQELDIGNLVIGQTGRGKTTLLGIPVRFTVDDEPDTPELQLVMEPVLRA